MNAQPPTSITRTPEDIVQRSDLEIPQLLLPEPSRLFAERALRLRQLAASHAMRDYLMLLALVGEAQHARVQSQTAMVLPTLAQLDSAAQEGQPALGATGWTRDGQWRAELRALLQQVLEQLPNDSPARAAVQAVIQLPDTTLEQQADRLLAGITLGLDLAAAPLIAAGLQLYFTQLVAATGATQLSAFPVPTQATRCPCCGSLPVTSIIRLGGQQEGQRYLYCTLCNAQWHLGRIQCTHCLATQGIHYESLRPNVDSDTEPKRPVVEAEACDSCHHYLKIMHVARDLHVEPVADDLATLTLDLLVSEAGFSRHGTNMLLLFGDDEHDTEPGAS